MNDEHEVWPPPPTQPPPAGPAEGPGRPERVCGAVSLILCLAWLVLIVIAVVVAMRTAVAGPTGRDASLMLSGGLGLVGRRTIQGKVGLGLTLGVMLILGGLYWLGLQRMSH